MPKRNNYPNWFNVNRKPHCPSKPKKPLKEESIDEVVKEEASIEFNFTKEEILKIDFDNVKIYSGPLSGNCWLKFSKSGLYPNKSYELQMDYYKSSLERYRLEKEEYTKQVKEWPVLVEKWKAEEQKEREKKDLKKLAELEEKYKNVR